MPLNTTEAARTTSSTSSSSSSSSSTSPSPSLSPSQTSILKPPLLKLLRSRAFPKTICPSEVARALSPAQLRDVGCAGWREAMPLIRELVWRMRDDDDDGDDDAEERGEGDGKVEVLQKGEVLGREVGLGDVRGPIRVRFAAAVEK